MRLNLSRSAADEVTRRSLVRLVVPVSLSADLDAWLESPDPGRAHDRVRELTRRVEELLPDVSLGESASLARRHRFPTHIARWRRLKQRGWAPLAANRLDDLRSVLAPQVVDTFDPGDTDLPAPVAVFSRSAPEVAERYGQVHVLLSESRAARAGAHPIGASDGHLCVLGRLQLILCSVGVALVVIDLHPLLGADLDGAELERFVAAAQYVPGFHRRGQAPVLASPLGPVVAAVGAHVAPLRHALRKQLGAVMGKDLPPEQRRLANLVAGALLERADVAPAQARALSEWVAGARVASPPEEVRALLDQAMVDAGAGPEEAGPLVDHFAGCLRGLAPAGEALPLRELLDDALVDLGMHCTGDAARRVVLNGDRAFAFTHARTSLQGAEACRLAARLSRRHTRAYSTRPGDGDPTSDQFFQPFSDRVHALALEGVALVDLPGPNQEFALNLTVPRERHWLLVALAMVYRYALLNMTLHSVSIRDSSPAEELKVTERLHRRIEYFTHWIYHGHVSNISHLQDLFDAVLARANVAGLWEQLDRDIPRYKAFREAVEREAREKRGRHIELVVSVGAAFIVVKEVLELIQMLTSSQVHDVLDQWVHGPEVAAGAVAAGVGAAVLAVRWLVRRARVPRLLE